MTSISISVTSNDVHCVSASFIIVHCQLRIDIICSGTIWLKIEYVYRTGIDVYASAITCAFVFCVYICILSFAWCISLHRSIDLESFMMIYLSILSALSWLMWLVLRNSCTGLWAKILILTSTYALQVTTLNEFQLQQILILLDYLQTSQLRER